MLLLLLLIRCGCFFGSCCSWYSCLWFPVVLGLLLLWLCWFVVVVVELVLLLVLCCCCRFLLLLLA